MATKRIAVLLPVQPWFTDHCFDGRAILPAVEAMRFLALTVQAARPGLDVREMHQASFAKFLEIPLAAPEIEVLVELEDRENKGLCARLLTRIQLKAMARHAMHCELSFGAGSERDPREVKMGRPCSALPEMEISAAQVYRELVPFGPAYQTLQGQLFLGKETARGTLRAPNLPLSAADPLGSPFPLDGAMHAACVHGQRLVDFVPFPVGFAARFIPAPTRAGKTYHTQVTLQSQAADELVYDLLLVDEAGEIRETVTGLRMRDVSGGRRKPPAWMRDAAGKAH